MLCQTYLCMIIENKYCIKQATERMCWIAQVPKVYLGSEPSSLNPG